MEDIAQAIPCYYTKNDPAGYCTKSLLGLILKPTPQIAGLRFFCSLTSSMAFVDSLAGVQANNAYLERTSTCSVPKRPPVWPLRIQPAYLISCVQFTTNGAICTPAEPSCATSATNYGKAYKSQVWQRSPEEQSFANVKALDPSTSKGTLSRHRRSPAGTQTSLPAFRMPAIKAQRVAVIGAGPAGAITTDALVKEGVFETIRVFDRRAGVGGTW